jgi:hypothetical protein
MSERASGSKLPALRYDLRTMTFQSNAKMMQGMKKIFEEEFGALLATEGFSGIVEWQLVTKAAIEQSTKMGGNILGLENSGSVVCMLIFQLRVLRTISSANATLQCSPWLIVGQMLLTMNQHTLLDGELWRGEKL